MRGHKGAGGAVVKAPLQRIAPGFGDRQPRPYIVGKSGVVARGKRQTVLTAIIPHQEAERAFGGNMEEFRPFALDGFGNCRRGRQCQPNFWVSRERQGAKLAWGEKGNLEAERYGF